MTRLAFPAGDDRGETLIETLISIVLLGILGLAVLDGTIVLSKSAALYDRQASAFKNQREWAEQLSAGSYSGCTDPGLAPTNFPSTDVGTMGCFPSASGFLKVTIAVRSTGGNKTFNTTTLDVLVRTHP
jgi:hypothetical protein